jgi:stage II sporulation protein D
MFHMLLARQTKKRSWDVDPTTWFQSYRGALVENSLRIDPAIQATRGEVAIHDGQVIEAFFSANSGGMTCSVSECFGYPDRPYIIAKPDIEGVQDKPGGTWHSKITSEGIHRRLEKMHRENLIDLNALIPGYSGLSSIAGLVQHVTGPSGRTWEVGIKMKDGSLITFDRELSKQFRWQFGLKTHYWFADPVQASGENQNVVGHGFGHGIGMSQWGASLLAEQGFTAHEIIEFYYHQVEVRRFQSPRLSLIHME